MQGLRRFAFVLIAVLAITQCVALAANDKGRPLKVMTRNVYQGTDFLEVMGATDFTDFTHQVTVTINNVRATEPAARMAAIAFEIHQQQPDLVALQEIDDWKTGYSPMSMTSEFEMLEMVIKDLKLLGTPYKIVNVIPEFQFVAPSDTGLWVGVTVRNAILVRAGSDADGIVISNPMSGLFPQEHTLCIPMAASADPVCIWRGWASVDVSMKDREFRFITVHPEAFAWQYEYAQVADLLQGPAMTTLPIVMAGDFNMQAANPEDPTYQYTYMMVTKQAGFTDGWAALGTTAPGYTCCQDLTLKNSTSTLDQRIDLVFVRGPFEVKKMTVTGDSQFVRNLLGLWPSDHAGLAAHLKLALYY